MIYGFNAKEVFQIAIDIEENGRAFYQKAQAKVEDEKTREVFKALELAEVQHKELFESLMAKLPPKAAEQTVWDPDNEMDMYLKMMADTHVFRTSASVDECLARVGSAREALEMALTFEKDSIVFFLTLKNMTEEKQGRANIDQLVNEELGHHKKISTELIRLGR